MQTSTTHKEKFYHFRNKDRGRADERIDGITVFLREETPGLWLGAAAICVKPDRFCRKTGRQVARRKYFQNEKSAQLFEEGASNYERAATIAEEAYYSWEQARNKRRRPF